MSTTPLSAKHHLASEITSALGEGASAQDIVELIVRCGWQPRPVPDPNSEYLEGVLEDGTRVPIEIRHASLTRAG
ncbi:hypothetical protein [Amnibacterium setariae]|uniref:hypothetical protein n=1 Tax=Amnibacterium setariae TaxID=2306585 RepID=UPI0011C477E1|nr:hypothetical protein [Amnibacterium setariae]